MFTEPAVLSFSVRPRWIPDKLMELTALRSFGLGLVGVSFSAL